MRYMFARTTEYLCSAGHESATRTKVRDESVAAPAPRTCHRPESQSIRIGKKS
jgi:hypothetical protein